MKNENKDDKSPYKGGLWIFFCDAKLIPSTQRFGMALLVNGLTIVGGKRLVL
jgi:hypothetical protein